MAEAQRGYITCQGHRTNKYWAGIPTQEVCFVKSILPVMKLYYCISILKIHLTSCILNENMHLVKRSILSSISFHKKFTSQNSFTWEMENPEYKMKKEI